MVFVQSSWHFISNKKEKKNAIHLSTHPVPLQLSTCPVVYEIKSQFELKILFAQKMNARSLVFFFFCSVFCSFSFGPFYTFVCAEEWVHKSSDTISASIAALQKDYLKHIEYPRSGAQIHIHYTVTIYSSFKRAVARHPILLVFTIVTHQLSPCIRQQFGPFPVPTHAHANTQFTTLAPIPDIRRLRAHTFTRQWYIGWCRIHNWTNRTPLMTAMLTTILKKLHIYIYISVYPFPSISKMSHTCT